MKRLILHPGFHKTGTSSIQHFLWVNHTVLAPHLDIYLLRHLSEAVRLCRRYAKTQNPLELMDLVSVLDVAFAQTPDDDRDILISCEGLSGEVPGTPGVATYAALSILARYLTGYLAERFPGHTCEIVLTTRMPEPWLHSTWRHHLAGHRMKMDWPTYSRVFASAADLDDIVVAIRQDLAPTLVTVLPLEDAQQHPLGPGGAFLELLGLAHDVTQALQPVGHGNPGPDAALSAALLALNTGPLGPDDVKRHKQALLKSAGVGGWKKP